MPGIAQVFGLSLESHFDLGLPLADGGADLAVVPGTVEPGDHLLLHIPPPHPFTCTRNDDEIVLAWPGAQFGITADQIVVDAVDPQSAANRFLQPCLAVVLAARGRVALHGCAVEGNGCCAAILGGSGAGKTTAGLALLDRGWSLVTDDLLTFDAADRVIPGPPYVRLAPDTSIGRPGRFDWGGKLRYYPTTCSHPVRLTTIIVLADTYPTCHRFTGTAAVDALLTSSYVSTMTHDGQARRRFDLAVALARHIPIYGAPPRSLTPDQMEELVEEVPQ